MFCQLGLHKEDTNILTNCSLRSRERERERKKENKFAPLMLMLIMSCCYDGSSVIEICENYLTLIFSSML